MTAAPLAGGTSAVSLFTYGPYGERTSWGGSRFAYTGQIALPEASLYHYKARAYDPARGWFLQTDPIGYEAGDFNLYAYTGGDPVNKSDPSGKRDIYIGGAADKDTTRLVQDYALRQQILNPNRDIQYFSWADQKRINQAVSAPLAKGEPLNIIGHSLGGASAITAANLTAARITNLLTIDPVAQAGDGSKPAGVAFWGNVNAAPKDMSNFSDIVAATGRALFGQTATSAANSQINIDAHHGDFLNMMDYSGMNKIVSQSYSSDPQACGLNRGRVNC